MIPRLLICTGARTWPSRARVAAELAIFTADRWAVIHGACSPRIINGVRCSADALVDDVALEIGHVVGVSLHRRPADWNRLGPKAGPIRNEAMAKEAARGIIERRWSSVRGLAFGDLVKPDGRPTGTGGMVLLMRRQGWPVRHVPAPDAEAHTIALHVYTASLKQPGIYDEPDLLDITRGTGGPAGSPFAPSWGILRPALAKLRQGGAVAEEGWAEYEPLYIAEMRVSYGRMPVERYGPLELLAVEHGVEPCPEAWTNLLAAERRVIACHCPPSAVKTGWCHRFLLARILERLGARYAGELPAAPQRQGRLPDLG